MLWRSFPLALSILAALALVPADARAQEAGTTGTENINSPTPNPERFLLQSGAYVDVTGSPRPQNLNPTGVNFTDCEQDLRLDFSLVISGFNPGDNAHIEVWAGNLDCTQDVNRSGSSAGVSQPCWKVAAGTGAQFATTSDALPPISIYARDVLRYEQIQPTGTVETYDPTFHNGPSGEGACHVQSSDSAVSLDIYFIAINSSFQAIGTAYKYPLNTDLVAPPAPIDQTIAAGDTLATVNWTPPGNDPDIAGYAIYADPPAGGSTTGGCSCGSVPGNGANSYIGDGAAIVADATTQRCIDAAADVGDDSTLSSDGSSDAADDSSDGGVEASMPEASMPEASMPEASTEGGTSDAGVTVDAGGLNCSPINVGGSGEAGACASENLTGGSFVVGGTTSSGDGGTVVTDDSGSDGGVVLGGGGIAQIPIQFKAAELDTPAATSITLTGLTNYTYYKVAVVSIDGSGNVGPVSSLLCTIPAPTNDFWGTYKKDGGNASSCALGGGAGAPIFGIGIAAAAAALARRRRR